MARENNYIYYEADCMLQLINPFMDIHAENPFLAAMQSKPLKVGTVLANAIIAPVKIRCKITFPSM